MSARKRFADARQVLEQTVAVNAAWARLAAVGGWSNRVVHEVANRERTFRDYRQHTLTGPHDKSPLLDAIESVTADVQAGRLS